jgi:aromatic-L-amino-acid/L-tryptophan decarboxylase
VPLEQLVVYGTTQTHSVGAKAALILGLSFRALEVRREDEFSLRGETLKEALEEDIKAGKAPFILSKRWTHFTQLSIFNSCAFSVVATLGTTSSGAIDNLEEIEEIGELPFVASISYSAH